MIKPVVSEKSFKQSDELKCYTFITSPEETKNTVKTKIEKMFGVEVDKVRSISGRTKRRFNAKVRKTVSGKKYKKFFVFVKPGSEIEFFKNK
ncbi:50S ribosomal protein L23 [Candidatus Dojkabacteria bacterium]|nr:50S ribosomal protein L23 [Candidatus Dojkabacteria bacterium]